MKQCFFIAAIFVASSSFFWKPSLTKSHFHQSATIFDFFVQRLSGERVLISWHTQNESPGVRFEVMRQDRRASQYFSVDVVNPNKQSGPASIADYAYIDSNNNADSSFYRIKKKTEDGVVFFSIPKGVEGLGKHRE